MRFLVMFLVSVSIFSNARCEVIKSEHAWTAVATGQHAQALLKGIQAQLGSQKTSSDFFKCTSNQSCSFGMMLQPLHENGDKTVNTLYSVFMDARNLVIKANNVRAEMGQDVDVKAVRCSGTFCSIEFKEFSIF